MIIKSHAHIAALLVGATFLGIKTSAFQLSKSFNSRFISIKKYKSVIHDGPSIVSRCIDSKLCATIDTEFDGVSFEDYSKRAQLRSWLLDYNASFQSSLGDVQTEVFTQLMEERKLENGDLLFEKGKDNTEFFIVSNGKFESFEKNEEGNEVKLFNYLPGNAVGDIEYATSKQHLFSVRATSDNASVWYIKTKDLDDIFDKKKSSIQESMISEYKSDNSQFQQYVEQTLDNDAKQEAIKKCKLLKGLPDETQTYLISNMKKRDYSSNEVVITQGDEADDVYVVRSGSFECYNEKRPEKIIKDYGKQGEFFGELGPVLGQKRALSIRVAADSEESSLWVIEKNIFLEAIKEGPLLNNAINILKEQYAEDNALTALSKLSPSELYNLAVTLSRPKKEPVSKHSLLGTVSTGFFVCALIPLFSPGLHAENGLPQVFDINLFNNPVQARVIGLLFVISAVTGYLRIPPRTPRIRRLFFEQCTSQSVVTYMLADSNIGIVTAGQGFTFDLVGGTGASLIFTAAFVVSMVKTMQFLEESIAAGPRGRDTIPLAPNRFWGTLTATFAYIGLVQMAAPVWLDHNPTAYENIVAPGLQVYEGVNLSMWFIDGAYMGFSMLIATLLFEKKLSQTQSAILVGLILPFVTGFWDIVAATYINPQFEVPTNLLSMQSYGSDVLAKYHANEAFLAVWVATVIKGLWRLYQESNEKDKIMKRG